MLAKGTEDQSKVCIVCKTEVKPDDRFVPVDGGIVHRDCHDTWVAQKK